MSNQAEGCSITVDKALTWLEHFQSAISFRGKDWSQLPNRSSS